MIQTLRTQNVGNELFQRMNSLNWASSDERDIIKECCL